MLRDPPPREVDTTLLDIEHLGHFMEVVALEAALHRAEVAVTHNRGHRLRMRICLSLLPLQLELAAGAQRKTKNASIVVFGLEDLLVVCVPSHRITAVPVEVNVATVGLAIGCEACHRRTIFPNLANNTRLNGWWHSDARILVDARATRHDREDRATRDYLSILLMVRVTEVLPWQFCEESAEPNPCDVSINGFGAICDIGSVRFVHQQSTPI
mmetsp:Transcript_72454/g.155157  ORF Transcript_72454/g.155157 Transcript_72454/m.155157 type:complete len:213 (+) Transcript_72454:179-817(+)